MTYRTSLCVILSLVCGVFLCATDAQAQTDQKEHDLKCLAHIHKEMAPYHGVPGLRGHMEGYSLQKHPTQDVFFWDSLNKDGKTTTRVIASKEGYIACKIGEGIDLNNVTFNDRALRNSSVDVLKENRMLAVFGSDISCKKISDDDGGLRVQGVMSKYLALIPEFYQEKVDDLAITIKDQEQRYKALDSISYISDLEKACTGGILRTINASKIVRQGMRVSQIYRAEFGIGNEVMRAPPMIKSSSGSLVAPAARGGSAVGAE
ncbi:MAG: hypothetical protein M9899_04815 [Bdellovibrionaceae bacterium]|nr:hypothetical protein [Pseudobdellovibrionaceae bacterium]